MNRTYDEIPRDRLLRAALVGDNDEAYDRSPEYHAWVHRTAEALIVVSDLMGHGALLAAKEMDRRLPGFARSRPRHLTDEDQDKLRELLATADARVEAVPTMDAAVLRAALNDVPESRLATCPVCGDSAVIVRDGKLALHWIDLPGEDSCPGSYGPVPVTPPGDDGQVAPPEGEQHRG